LSVASDDKAPIGVDPLSVASDEVDPIGVDFLLAASVLDPKTPPLKLNSVCTGVESIGVLPELDSRLFG